ncbi:hypothetical protein ACKI1Q_39545 [Streptomyces galilaeus]|uniref:hypothetical protein n=1 Tax=Streptomyces galilaeus TaxID=33899 RepID=UPI0038F677A4
MFVRGARHHEERQWVPLPEGNGSPSRTDLESPALVTTAMDCNVFADLYSTYNRNGAEETKAVSAQWLVAAFDHL